MIGHYGSYGGRMPAPDDLQERVRRSGSRTVQSSSTGRTATNAGLVGQARLEQQLADTTPKAIKVAAAKTASAAAAFTDFATGQTPGQGSFVSMDGGNVIAAPAEDGSWLPWIIGGIAVSAAVGGGIYYFTRNKKRK